MRVFANRPGVNSRVMLSGWLAGVVLCLSALPVDAGALEDGLQNPRVAEIITTGVRERPLSSLPRSANIITADDIALLPSSNIVDLLAREANLNLRSVLGNAKFSGVDIRGQGDTYSSNVQVLVDGVRLNAADLSGADYSSIPLDQIERIEVIRGANTVRYGSGAVGGVINIITKQADEGVALNARARAGSFATVDTGLGASWGGEQFSLAGDVNYHDSDGYRDNSGLETKDLTGRLGYQPSTWFSTGLRGEWHRDTYGLPGPVSKDDDPTSANSLTDGGETDDNRARLDFSLGTEQMGVLKVIGSLRDRENNYSLGKEVDSVPDTITQDDTRLEAQYDKSIELWQRTHSFTLGVDLVQTDYAREKFDNDGLRNLQNAKVGDIRETAWFAAADITLSESVVLSLGYRDDDFSLSRATYVLDCADEDKIYFFTLPDGTIIDLDNPLCGVPESPRPDAAGVTRTTWNNSAAEAGLVYSPTDYASWFISYAQSFRNPNVDELIVADDDLGPQTGDHFDIGMRQQFGDVVEWNLALFYSKTENEILFGMDPDGITAVNRNADEPTKRTGGETDLRWYVLSSLTLTANLGYINARFEGTGTTLPLVPKWTGALGAQWQPMPAWLWTVAANYVGERYDGNDFANQMSRLDDYQVVDTRLTYEQGSLQLYAGINNLFDEVYAASAYSNQFYPMPDRNYYAGLAYRIRN